MSDTTDNQAVKKKMTREEVGRLGGRKKVPKGFAVNRELARKAGAKGGKISKRGKKNDDTI